MTDVRCEVGGLSYNSRRLLKFLPFDDATMFEQKGRGKSDRFLRTSAMNGPLRFCIHWFSYD